MVDRIGKDRCGTGDVIAAVIAGSYLNGLSFYESVKKRQSLLQSAFVIVKKRMFHIIMVYVLRNIYMS